jgi:hypothetical protein
VLAPAEYWTFLGAAGLLAVSLAMPKTSDGRGQLAKRPGTGAFGTTRSSDAVAHKNHLIKQPDYSGRCIRPNNHPMPIATMAVV